MNSLFAVICLLFVIVSAQPVLADECRIMREAADDPPFSLYLKTTVNGKPVGKFQTLIGALRALDKKGYECEAFSMYNRRTCSVSWGHIKKDLIDSYVASGNYTLSGFGGSTYGSFATVSELKEGLSLLTKLNF